MALIIYPTADYDSFISVADCETTSDAYIYGNKFSQLATVEGKEAILRQTCLSIRQCNNIVLPADIESNLEVAQVYLVEQALTINMIAYDANEGAIIEEHAGAVGASYDSSKKAADNSAFPPMVSNLLSTYGCTSTSGGFSQGSVGRS